MSLQEGNPLPDFLLGFILQIKLDRTRENIGKRRPGTKGSFVYKKILSLKYKSILFKSQVVFFKILGKGFVSFSLSLASQRGAGVTP
ncbi:MAG: hypothetical protein B1H02_03495 [Candidatus Latescibacteria bacterium 4484_107]|nr:MAG: hypothetical protein B1H02_03495 [Candidatus Latescibacteria bacterium 4484_107]